MVDWGIAPTQMTALKRAAVSGDYHLLLGAGASRDSVSRIGSNLPGSMELAKQLATAFDVSFDDQDDLLWRVYDRATHKVGAHAVYDWLRGLFHAVNPPSWMDLFARFPWQCVWTLNLDDSFEQSYRRVATEQSRRLRPVNWDEQFSLTRDLAVVHLHGKVDNDIPERLVFSLSEYADAAVAQAAWPAAFRDNYGIAPFVIIGARLRDEPDIEAVVARRRPAHAAPSFYVNRSISDTIADDLRSWNLIPIKMAGEEFSAEWARLTGVDLAVPPSAREEITLRMGMQFRELRTDRSDKPSLDNDLIGGDEPRWSNITSRQFAQLDWIRDASDALRRLGTSTPSSSGLVYVGERLTGRSTGLLALGLMLRQAYWRTFLFSADQRIDIEAVLAFAADGRPTALLFDGITDYADDVSRLLGGARAAGLSIACIGVDHSGRSAGLLGRIDANYLVSRSVRTINAKLTNTDAARIVDKLKELTRLGTLEKLKDPARRRHFHGSELFDAMAQVENAPGFGRRVGDVVRSVEEEDLPLLLFASLAARVGVRLRVVDAARMAGVDSEYIARRIAGAPPLASLIFVENSWVQTRQRWLALSFCILRLGESQSLDVLAEGLERISRGLGHRSVRERNARALLVGSFMKYNNLRLVFPGADLEPWYSQLAGSYGRWSARYWEQRAIASRHEGVVRPDVLARAESYARRAVSIIKDTYSLTTLGTVLLAKAAQGDEAILEKYYDEAIDCFEDSHARDSGNLVTWMAYLRLALPVLTRLLDLRPGGDLQERIVDDWTRIHGQVSAAAASSDSTDEDLRGLRRLFDRIQTGDK